jgi:hypothetical protein
VFDGPANSVNITRALHAVWQIHSFICFAKWMNRPQGDLLNSLPPEDTIMKRTILVAAAAAVAFGSGFSGARTVTSHNAPVVRVAWEGGEGCTTENGRSGYMVSSGRGWECVESGSAL